jgi:preprotein translocase subunit SecA
MRLFASDKIASIMTRFNIPDDVPIEAKLVSRSIERAQSQVEAMNFEIRKNVLKYDEVMDIQRKIIYEERRKILEGEDLHEQALEIVAEVVESATLENASSEVHPEEWDWEQLFARVREIYPTRITPGSFDHDSVQHEEVVETFLEDALAYYREREEVIGSDQLREIERLVLLSVIDNRWREHLYEMDYLQEGIGLRAMAQRDPLVEYQREGYIMFQQLQETIKEDFARYVFHVEAVREDRREPTRMRQERRQIPMAAARPPQQAPDDGGFEDDGGGVAAAAGGEDFVPVQQAVSDKIPRNAPCPCGSGKKYKMCHGRPGSPPL